MSKEVVYPEEIQQAIVEGKNPERVHSGYIKYPKDWEAQYNMLLLDGYTCASCVHCQRCTKMFGQKETATSCQFYPSRFYPKNFTS